MSDLTEEQRAATEDRSGDLLVAAGAGSGKTRVMVERIVAAVLDDGDELGAILAITFTEKAAAELAERVRRRFVERGREDLAREVHGANISTIHGFCARLLRAHALAAGIDPRFEVLDEAATQRLSRAAYRGAFEAAVAAGDAALDELSAYAPDDLRDMVVAAHDELRVRGERTPALPPAPAPRDLASAVAALADAAAALARELGALLEPPASVAQSLEVAAGAGERLQRLGTELPTAVLLKELRIQGEVAGALRSDGCAAYRAAWAALAQARLDNRAAPVYTRVAELVTGYGERYAALKARRSAVDFEDLELLAAELLERDDQVREAYAGRFAHVLVDEFQDTNPVQLRIMGLVARANLFTVGDEQQAIYGFRHADVELFRARRAELERTGRVRSLRTSFRARPELIAAIDAAFADPDLGLPDFEPLRAPDVAVAEPTLFDVDPEGAPPVEVLVTAKSPAWGEVDLGAALPGGATWRLAEARLLAQRLRELVDAGRAPGEIVVLVRATTDIALYERALQDRGLPTYLVGGRGYWSHPQVQDVTAYLALVANPTDDLRLYEALASSLAGVSSDALVLLAAASEERPAWDSLQGIAAGDVEGAAAALEPEDRARMTAFAQRLTEHRAAAPRLALDALIERAVADSGYDLAVLRMPGGDRRLANVRKLMRLAREFEANEGHDLRGLVDLVDLLASDASGAREGEAPLEGEDLDAIRLMTIHRSKGAEFPVVCLADLGRVPIPAGRELLRLGRDGRVGMRFRSSEGLENGTARGAFDWDAVGEAATRAQEAEERRLVYVAATRAEELLVLSGALPLARWDQAREPLAWMTRALVPDLPRTLTVESPVLSTRALRGEWSARVDARLSAPETVGAVLAPESLAPAPPARGTAAPPAPAAPAVSPPSAAPAAPARLSYSALTDYARCAYRFYAERVLRLPPPPPAPGADGAAGLAATTRGTIVHALLERLDLAGHGAPDPAAIDAAATAAGAVLSDAERADVATLVEAFAAAPLRARLAAAADVRREAPFIFQLGSGPAAPLVTGFFDVLARDDDAALVVDYKTDRVGDADLEQLVDRDYRTQRLVYALAALRAGAREVEVAHCFLERADEPVLARFDERAAPALEAELVALAAGAAAGEYPVTQSPHRELCAPCPARGTLCSWPQEVVLARAPEDGTRPVIPSGHPDGGRASGD